MIAEIEEPPAIIAVERLVIVVEIGDVVEAVLQALACVFGALFALGFAVARDLEETWGSNVDLETMWPDADEAGYVRYPNVNVTEEMIDLMDTRRAYEANATVFDAMKSMLRRATQI